VRLKPAFINSDERLGIPGDLLDGLRREFRVRMKRVLAPCRGQHQGSHLHDWYPKPDQEAKRCLLKIVGRSMRQSVLMRRDPSTLLILTDPYDFLIPLIRHGRQGVGGRVPDAVRGDPHGGSERAPPATARGARSARGAAQRAGRGWLKPRALLGRLHVPHPCAQCWRRRGGRGGGDGRRRAGNESTTR